MFGTERTWIHSGPFSTGGEQVTTSSYYYGGVCVRAVDSRLAVARYALRHLTEADCQRPVTNKLETGFSPRSAVLLRLLYESNPITDYSLTRNLITYLPTLL